MPEVTQQGRPELGPESAPQCSGHRFLCLLEARLLEPFVFHTLAGLTSKAALLVRVGGTESSCQSHPLLYAWVSRTAAYCLSYWLKGEHGGFCLL